MVPLCGCVDWFPHDYPIQIMYFLICYVLSRSFILSGWQLPVNNKLILHDKKCDYPNVGKVCVIHVCNPPGTW